MSQFNQLSDEDKQHWEEAINYALDELHQHGWPAKNNSTGFDVVFNGLYIPPKQVVALAFDYLDNQGVDTNVNNIKGGDEYTNTFLKDFGLKIVPKRKKLDHYLDKIDVWHDWKNNYHNFVPAFINEAKKGENWSQWNGETFYEFFEKSNAQCVSSLKQGYFTKEEKQNIKENWNEISPLLQHISSSQDEPLYNVFNDLRSCLRKYTKQDRRAATYRLVASLQPRSLCTVINHDRLNELIGFLNMYVQNADIPTSGDWFKSSNDVLNFFVKESSKDLEELITYPWQLLEFFHGNEHIEHNDMSENIDDDLDRTIKLLYYKKQIVLQGPPGTGKTRLAKKLATRLTKPKFILDADISDNIYLGQEIFSKEKVTYKISKIDRKFITVELEGGTSRTCNLDSIKEAYANYVNGIPLSGGDTYSTAIAISIFNAIDSENNNIVQFHPSYTYEDFVRGITVKTGEKGNLTYEAENKTLARLAKQALDNYQLHQKNLQHTDPTSDEILLDRYFLFIKESVNADPEGKFYVSDSLFLFVNSYGRIRYKHVSWKDEAVGFDLDFAELRKIIQSNPDHEDDVKANSGLFGQTRNHSAYYFPIYQNYLHFKDNKLKEPDKGDLCEVRLRNYVLIIDEINRANLSSVLGELIYALEYRCEYVDSMYGIDGSNKLALPPNLYIIGTMNTADRSVGHIDYAIRRRFAFVDVLPEQLSDSDEIWFNYCWLPKRIAALW